MTIGRRQANKLDKLKRIREAARHHFLTMGYDDTTMRQIANRAHVALGTLFSYASNKRDLLFLVANKELEQAALQAAACVKEDRSLVENLLVIFGLHYQVFAAQPGLSRLFLRELLFYDSGEQALRAIRIRAGLMRTIVDAIDAAKQIGEIRSRKDSELIARAFFGLYQSEIRRWLGHEPVAITDGLQELHRSLDLLLGGLVVDREVATVNFRRVLAGIQSNKIDKTRQGIDRT